MLRPDRPGIPDLYTGLAQRDPIPITIENVKSHLVGWMPIEALSRSMGIKTPQARSFLMSFLTERSDFSHRNEDGVIQWSNFHGTTL